MVPLLGCEFTITVTFSIPFNENTILSLETDQVIAALLEYSIKTHELV